MFIEVPKLRAVVGLFISWAILQIVSCSSKLTLVVTSLSILISFMIASAASRLCRSIEVTFFSRNKHKIVRSNSYEMRHKNTLNTLNQKKAPDPFKYRQIFVAIIAKEKEKMIAYRLHPRIKTYCGSCIGRRY